jgi:hypothetical protein
VIGVLEKRKAGFFGENEEDNAVFIPDRTAQKVAPARGYMLLLRGRAAGAGGADPVGRDSEDVVTWRLALPTTSTLKQPTSLLNSLTA